MEDSFTGEGDGAEDVVAPTSAETAEEQSARPTVNREVDKSFCCWPDTSTGESTSQQTRWAAKILRGESAIFLKCRQWIIIDLGGIQQYYFQRTSKHLRKYKKTQPSFNTGSGTNFVFPKHPKGESRRRWWFRCNSSEISRNVVLGDFAQPFVHWKVFAVVLMTKKEKNNESGCYWLNIYFEEYLLTVCIRPVNQPNQHYEN